MRIDEIKDRLNIVDVLQQSGKAELYQSGRQYTGWHTAHESRSKCSLHVDPQKGVYHCWSCGQGGDVITWLGHEEFGEAYSDRNPHMFKTALATAAALAGVTVASVDAETIAVRRQMEAIFALAAEFYHTMLPSDLRQYLRKHYGLSDETIDELKIGYSPAEKIALVSYLLSQGISRDELAMSGLVLKFGSQLVDFFQGRLMFPYWRGGRPLYFIGRKTEDTPDEEWERGKYKKQLVHNEKHSYVSDQVRNDYFYGEDAIRGSEIIFVTEGVTDCIAANQHGFPCISPVTIQFRDADHAKLIELCRHATAIYIVNDNEASEAGLRGALSTAEALWRAGKIARLVHVPRPDGAEKIDLNEFLRDFGAEPFKSVAPREDSTRLANRWG